MKYKLNLTIQTFFTNSYGLLFVFINAELYIFLQFKVYISQFLICFLFFPSEVWFCLTSFLSVLLNFFHHRIKQKRSLCISQFQLFSCNSEFIFHTSDFSLNFEL